MKRVFIFVLLIVFLITTGCYTMVHRVGTGGNNTTEKSERQWYFLFGLIELNHVDSYEMADGAENYTVTTDWTPVDFIITLFSSMILVTPWTITVSE